MMTAILRPSDIRGSVKAPPSKSMAHRLLVCAALADGYSRIAGIDLSADVQATMAALQELGARITQGGDGSVQVEGMPGGFASAPVESTAAYSVPCGESGSTLRFMVPLFSLTGRPARFTGAARLFQRPLSVYQEIYAGQGLSFRHTGAGLTTAGRLQSGAYRLPGNVSSQFVSGLLFALPLLEGDSVIHIAPPVESRSYIELTRGAQAAFGVHSEWLDGETLAVPGGQSYAPGRHAVEGDWSQAAVPAVLGAVLGGVSLLGLSPNSAQGDRVIVDIITRCGAMPRWQGDVLEIRSGSLHAPGDIDLADCPDLGPILCTLALFCEGTTRIVNAGRLRIKESDRIASVEAELKKLGGEITSTEDSITIHGGRPLKSGAVVNSHNDHRVVMAAAAAALCAGVGLRIEGAEAVNKSWPGFFEDMAGLGAEVEKA